MPPAVARPDSEQTVRLLDLVRQGNRQALDELLAQHRDGLRTFIDLHLDRAVRGRVDPSDVVQEAQLELARRLPDYLARRPMPFHLWARKTAYERLLNARRDQRAACRDVGREGVGPDPSSLAVARSLVRSEPTPSELAQANELAERVAAVVAGLSEADREILALRQVDSLPYEEIGPLLDIDPGAARQRYGRALLRLQKVLRDEGLLGDSR
jgi:RNA polymerase sigma-70 factor (ECF subfamily)